MWYTVVIFLHNVDTLKYPDSWAPCTRLLNSDEYAECHKQAYEKPLEHSDKLYHMVMFRCIGGNVLALVTIFLKTITFLCTLFKIVLRYGNIRLSARQSERVARHNGAVFHWYRVMSLTLQPQVSQIHFF